MNHETVHSKSQIRHFVDRFTLGPLLLVLVLSYTGFTQNEPPAAGDGVIRVETSLVSIPVSVTDREGRFLSGVRQDQFHVFENGKEQPIAYFGGNDTPIVVALVLDMSDSTRFKLADIQEAAIRFIEQLQPNDRALVMAFDKRVHLLSEVTGDRDALMAAVRKIQVGGGTSVYNAVDTVLRQYLARIRGRKAVVLFTDGVDTTSASATYDSTIRLATESDSMFYAIKFDTYTDVTEEARKRSLAEGQVSTSIGGQPSGVVYERAGRYLSLLPEVTGGRLYTAGSNDHLSHAFSQIIGELRSQYLLAFYPEDQTKQGRRKIVVKIDVPRAKVRARKYYYFESAIR